MQNQGFSIGYMTMWILSLSGAILSLIGAFAKIQQLSFYNILLDIGITLLIVSWVLVVSDIARNKIFNKTFWMISVLFIPAVSLFIYLVRRKKLFGSIPQNL